MGYPIMVRMDDVCPRMNREKFDRYYHLLENLGIKPLLGVIPYCEDQSFTSEEDPDFWERMKEFRENGCPIAMHGVHHVYTSESLGLVCSRPMSEFAGLPLDKQVEILNKGKQKMIENGLDTDIFMAPGHSYDRNTLKALEKCGFRYVSDGRSFHPYEAEGIVCIPVGSSYRLHFNRGGLTICIHSDAEDERSIRNTITFLERNKDRIISFEDAMQLNRYPYWFSRAEEKMNMKFDSLLLAAIRKIRRA